MIIRAFTTLWSIFLITYLRIRGSKVHWSVRFLGFPRFRVSSYSSITISKGTQIESHVTLWQNGLGSIRIGCQCYVGIGTIINSTSNTGTIAIGDGTLIGAYCIIQDNDHGTAPGKPIRSQEFDGAPILIGNDCWLGASCCVLKGVRIMNGSVVGAGAVVVKDVTAGTIVGGIPARPISDRVRTPGL